MKINKNVFKRIIIFIKMHKNIIIIVCAIFLIIAGIIVNNIDFKKENTDIIENNSVIKETFDVCIKGEVRKNRTLTLDSPTYLYEIINMCDGFTEYANVTNINLIELVSSNRTIIIENDGCIKDNNIYFKDISNNSNKCLLYFGYINEKINIYIVNKNKSLYEILWMLDIDNSNYENKIIEDDISFITSKSTSNLININTATIDELKTLDRIGSSIAKRIVEYRENNGNFKNIQEIMNVSGISENIYALIKDKICVG